MASLIARYYAQFCETDPVFRSHHPSSWQVFDRHITTEGGQETVVGLFANRARAFAARDALNQEEKVTRRVKAL